MRLRKQALALFLAGLMLVSNVPAVLASADTTPPEFPDYTAQLYTKSFDPNNPTANQIKDGAQISKFDTLYYVIEKPEMVSESGPSENDVQEGMTYRISLPDPLRCAETYEEYDIIADYPRDDGTSGSVRVGTFSMQTGTDNITVCCEIPDNVEENPDQIVLEQLTEFHLSFACKLDEDALEEQVDEKGNLTIALPQDQSLQLVVTEMLPVAPFAQRSQRRTAVIRSRRRPRGRSPIPRPMRHIPVQYPPSSRIPCRKDCSLWMVPSRSPRKAAPPGP